MDKLSSCLGHAKGMISNENTCVWLMLAFLFDTFEL